MLKILEPNLFLNLKMHLIEGVATEVYNAYFPHSIALSDAVNLAAKGQKFVFFPVLRLHTWPEQI